MKEQALSEPVRVLFHLNGYTKVLLERTDGVGLADGGVVWDIPTDAIPAHLRKIGSRFVVQYTPPGPEGLDDTGAVRGSKDGVTIRELDGA